MNIIKEIIKHPALQILLAAVLSFSFYAATMGAWASLAYFSDKYTLTPNWVAQPAIYLAPVAALILIISALSFHIRAFIASVVMAMCALLTVYHYDTHWETALKKREIYAFQKQEKARALAEADHLFKCGDSSLIALTDADNYFKPKLHNFKEKRLYVEYFPAIGKERGKVYQLGLFPGGFDDKTLPQHIKSAINGCAYGGITAADVLSTFHENLNLR